MEARGKTLFLALITWIFGYVSQKISKGISLPLSFSLSIYIFVYISLN